MKINLKKRVKHKLGWRELKSSVSCKGASKQNGVKRA